MKKIGVLFAVTLLLFSCNRAKNAAKNAVDAGSDVIVKTAKKGGEVIGESSASFVNALGNGVENANGISLKIAKDLKNKGIEVGNFEVSRGLETNNNQLSLYLAFDADVNQVIQIKVKNKENLEIGRVYDTIVGKKGEANYFDFQFHPKTDIQEKSTIFVE